MIDLQLVEYLAYGLIGLLLLAAIILGIINWTRLFSLSAQIVSLENDIEKKTFEYANLKKSRPGAPQAQAPGMMVHNQPAKDETDTADNDEIHVVRNVRAGVEEEKESFLQDEVVQMGHAHAPVQEPLPVEPPAPVAVEPVIEAPVEIPEKPEPVIEPPAPETEVAVPETPMPVAEVEPLPLLEPSAPQAPEQDALAATLEAALPAALPTPQGDVMDVIDPNDENGEFNIINDTIVVPLYSMAKKDADFEEAFANFSSTVPLNAGTPVTVDFTHVMFLYEKELSILEHMKELARQFSCKLTFTNCHSEIKTILQSRKGLSELTVA